jgi:hypothetical protein
MGEAFDARSSGAGRPCHNRTRRVKRITKRFASGMLGLKRYVGAPAVRVR